MDEIKKPRRITERAVAEGEDAELAALIGGARREGMLEGVHVDFHHQDLPRGEWETLPWWDVWPNAGLVFPGEAKFGMAELRRCKRASEDEPAIFALPGDRLTIERVQVSEGDARFDHEHDRQVRLATLRLERPTGEVLYPSAPLPFYGVGRVQKHGTRESFDHILERILRHNGVVGFPVRAFDDLRNTWSLSLEEAALRFIEEAHDNYFALLARLPADGMGTARAELRSVANNAAVAGFLLAKIEAERPTLIATKSVDSAKNAAESRKDPRMIDMGKLIAAQHPTWRRNRIAKELLGHFPGRELSSINRTLRTENIGPSPT